MLLTAQIHEDQLIGKLPGWSRAGGTNKDIAALFIAEGMVKIHLHNIYEKTNVSRRAELVRFAQEYGLA